ncbi:MAG: class I SAM-dependent RNA methyltransferase [Spirochaetaceae bacterium]|jgi:putative N6-adenine-specific DNA methylase|nr:class I SAM-dependent RNA methyltransferase [Spirochaetaceae bacterium]
MLNIEHDTPQSRSPRPVEAGTGGAGAFTVTALCALGAEKICAAEIRALLRDEADGAHVSGSGFGRVTFTANLAAVYRALFALRTADRLLLRCAAFPAADFDELFDGIHQTELERFVPATAGLVVEKVRTNRSRLAAETSIQAVAHKAAAQRLCRVYGLDRLPDVDTAGIRCALRVYLEKDRAELLLDLSGDPLFKRGYRVQGGAAPLRETSAASVLLLSRWRRRYPLYDPFCGSGTIAIEAALYGCNLAPNLGRRFALDTLLIADAPLREQVRQGLLARADFSNPPRITASDHDNALIALAKANAAKAFSQSGAPPSALPVFYNQPASAARSFSADCGFIVTNPPYGKRLGTIAEAEEGYKNMAALKPNFDGWKIVVVSDHAGFESFFGEKSDECGDLTNGNTRAYVYQFNGRAGTAEQGGGGKKDGGAKKDGGLRRGPVTDRAPPGTAPRPLSAPPPSAGTPPGAGTEPPPPREKKYTW